QLKQKKVKLAHSARNKARATKNKTRPQAQEWVLEALSPKALLPEALPQEPMIVTSSQEDIDGANLVISHLFAASAANFKEKTCPATYIDNNTDMIDEGIPIDRLDSNEIISETIKFVNDIIREEQLSDAEKAHYIAVLYFLQLLIEGKKKLKHQKQLPRLLVVDHGLLNVLESELIQNFREKFPSKSLLNDELVSLQVATYLCSQKFKVNQIVVKNYVENQVLPQLNGAMKRISIRTIH
ncbi:41545_t:CDS:2, partial [Gigaspora margarita]